MSIYNEIVTQYHTLSDLSETESINDIVTNNVTRNDGKQSNPVDKLLNGGAVEDAEGLLTSSVMSSITNSSDLYGGDRRRPQLNRPTSMDNQINNRQSLNLMQNPFDKKNIDQMNKSISNLGKSFTSEIQEIMNTLQFNLGNLFMISKGKVPIISSNDIEIQKLLDQSNKTQQAQTKLFDVARSPKLKKFYVKINDVDKEIISISRQLSETDNPLKQNISESKDNKKIKSTIGNILKNTKKFADKIAKLGKQKQLIINDIKKEIDNLISKGNKEEKQAASRLKSEAKQLFNARQKVINNLLKDVEKNVKKLLANLTKKSVMPITNMKQCLYRLNVDSILKKDPSSFKAIEQFQKCVQSVQKGVWV